jgi:serine protease
MRAWAAQHHGTPLTGAAPRAAATGPRLTYGGGNPGTGVGVTTGPPKVYLVFYGSQWGAPSTDGNGDLTFANDPAGEAPYLQEFFKGVGTSGERWSGVMTQYCDGVSQGAASCPSGSAFVGYPAGGALAGVWADESTASPYRASGFNLANEADQAAAHFGNTGPAANRDAQYVIISPTGTDPDSWLESGFCAWHDWNGDASLEGGPAPSSAGDIAFTNLPYQPDEGTGCGQDFVNPGSAGALDGVSIVAGHEYAETITDQEPGTVNGTTPVLPYGWFDANFFLENADICAWLPPGADGGSMDLATGTGTFAVQTTWANDSGVETPSGCEAGHRLDGVTPPNTVTVSLTSSRDTPVGTAVSFPVTTTDSDPGQTAFTYSATGLPPGAVLNPANGAISGTPAMAGVYHVTVAAADGSGSTGSAALTWTVNLIRNPGFESGVLSPWSATSGVLRQSTSNYPAHSGHWVARLDGRWAAHTDSLSQKVKIPADFQAHYSFYLRVNSNDPTTKAYDKLTVEILNSTGSTVLRTLARYSNLSTRGKYIQHSFSLASYLGRTVIIKFIGKQTLTGHNTAFLIDDNAVIVH